MASISGGGGVPFRGNQSKKCVLLASDRIRDRMDSDESGIFNTKEYRLSLAYDSVTGDQVEIFKLMVLRAQTELWGRPQQFSCVSYTSVNISSPNSLRCGDCGCVSACFVKDNRYSQVFKIPLSNVMFSQTIHFEC